MAVVVDASLLVVLVSADPRRPVVEGRMRAWLEAGEELHAPELLPYEVASGLTRLVSGGVLPAERVEETWRSAMAVPITYHPLRADGAQAVQIALGLARKSAYDAAYLALARRLAAPLWTFDGPLARHARERGLAVTRYRAGNGRRRVRRCVLPTLAGIVGSVAPSVGIYALGSGLGVGSGPGCFLLYTLIRDAAILFSSVANLLGTPARPGGPARRAAPCLVC